MKKLLVSLLFFCISIQAQIVYNFEVSQANYESLTAGDLLVPGQIWDDINAGIPLGFEFPFSGSTINTLFLTDEFLGCNLQGNPNNDIENPIFYIVPYETDLRDRGAANGVQSLSPIRYTTEGNEGNRIFKMQWKNAGFFDELFEFGTMNDFVNFQVWLYEADGKIVFKYGESQITNPLVNFLGEMGPLIGIGDLSQSEPLLLNGNPSNPNISASPFGAQTLDATPPDGTVYTFTPQPVNFSSLAIQSLNVYPNPAQNFIKIELDEIAEIKAINLKGQVYSLQPNQQVKVQHLANGIYFLQVKTHSGYAFQSKFLIQH